MYLQHFGLHHAPLGDDVTEPWDDGALVQLAQRFNEQRAPGTVANNWVNKRPGSGFKP